MNLCLSAVKPVYICQSPIYVRKMIIIQFKILIFYSPFHTWINICVQRLRTSCHQYLQFIIFTCNNVFIWTSFTLSFYSAFKVNATVILLINGTFIKQHFHLIIIPTVNCIWFMLTRNAKCQCLIYLSLSSPPPPTQTLYYGVDTFPI